RRCSRRVGTLAGPLSQRPFSKPARAEPFLIPFVIVAEQKERQAGGRHGSWAIVMAPRHSDPNHYFDMGAGRPSRLILPSGSSVVTAYEGPTPSRAFSLCASTRMRVILH